MTFTTKSAADYDLEQRQSDNNMAETAAIVFYTSHPADDAAAARALSSALPAWSSDARSAFIAQRGERLRESKLSKSSPRPTRSG